MLIYISQLLATGDLHFFMKSCAFVLNRCQWSSIPESSIYGPLKYVNLFEYKFKLIRETTSGKSNFLFMCYLLIIIIFLIFINYKYSLNYYWVLVVFDIFSFFFTSIFAFRWRWLRIVLWLQFIFHNLFNDHPPSNVLWDALRRVKVFRCGRVVDVKIAILKLCNPFPCCRLTYDTFSIYLANVPGFFSRFLASMKSKEE